MKKTPSLSALIAAALLAAVSTTPVSAADGTITFTGEILAVTCDVTGGSGTDGTSGSFAVTLPSVSASSLAAGQKAGYTNFTVSLSGGPDCKDGKTAMMHFEVPASPEINPVTGNLKNRGTATNVEVGLLNDAGVPINIYTGVGNSKADIVASKATLAYTAYYQALAAAADAGSVDTSVVYSMTYN